MKIFFRLLCFFNCFLLTCSSWNMNGGNGRVGAGIFGCFWISNGNAAGLCVISRICSLLLTDTDLCIYFLFYVFTLSSIIYLLRYSSERCSSKETFQKYFKVVIIKLILVITSSINELLFPQNPKQTILQK